MLNVENSLRPENFPRESSHTILSKNQINIFPKNPRKKFLLHVTTNLKRNHNFKTTLFTISFWFIASLVLLAERYQIAQHNLNVAYNRHVYLWLIGTLVSFAMISVFKSELLKAAFNRPIWQILVSCLAAIITALLLNPMLYLMAGHDLQNVLLEILSTGTLHFFLFY